MNLPNYQMPSSSLATRFNSLMFPDMNSMSNPAQTSQLDFGYQNFLSSPLSLTNKIHSILSAQSSSGFTILDEGLRAQLLASFQQMEQQIAFLNSQVAMQSRLISQLRAEITAAQQQPNTAELSPAFESKTAAVKGTQLDIPGVTSAWQSAKRGRPKLINARCFACGVKHSPFWRRVGSEHRFCNKCGLRVLTQKKRAEKAAAKDRSDVDDDATETPSPPAQNLNSNSIGHGNNGSFQQSPFNSSTSQGEQARRGNDGMTINSILN
eukprot:GILJ01011668.1.p1 GENE.GILJ01011668.1~~GILJ01011668.1.p1  ORF type:complete len:266 (+),score=32.40 GILJ01011668.1:202-999(+)